MSTINRKTKLSVFLSHANEDKSTVRRLCKRLKDDGFDPWLDEERLLPGQNWELEIEQALRSCVAVLLCFSEKSVAKEGFFQREFRRAQQFQEEKPEGTIYIIPVRLDKCEMPFMTQKLQWVDFPAKYKKLVLSLTRRNSTPSVKAKKRTTRKVERTSRPSKHTTPTAILEIAKREIQKKASELLEMQPGYSLGKPMELSDIFLKMGSRAIGQFYENGMISWHVDGEHSNHAFATYGSIYYRYHKLREALWTKFGLPISDERDTSLSPYLNNLSKQNRGRCSQFEHGEIIWYQDGEYVSQTFLLKDPFREVYESIGGTGSFLGFPVGEPQLIGNVERCDFEGGTIVSLKKGSGTHVVRQLFRINYHDSPFNHNWKQYDGVVDKECISIRIDSRIGLGKSYLAFNAPWDRRAISFPDERYADGEVSQQYCGITVKSLSPTESITVYIQADTDEVRPQYLEYESHLNGRRLVHDAAENTDYFISPMPDELSDGNWHTLVFDLQKSVKLGFGRNYESLKRFSFRGYIGIADLMVSDSREAIETIAINPIVVG